MYNAIETLHLARARDAGKAGLLIASVPAPRGAAGDWSLAGRPTFVKPLGKWPDAESPRRLLLIADNDGNPPVSLSLTRGNAAGAGPLPSAAMETFAHAPASDMPDYYWERSQLALSWGGKTLSLAMGLRIRDETHWWENCNLVVNGASPTCLEIEMGGAIPYEVTTGEIMRGFAGKDNPYIHKHNWVNGHVYARLHANGVCEVYAHHVNSMGYDDGADLKDAAPVIGFKVVGAAESLADLGATWDGSRRDLELGGIAFDLADVARLATPEQPGRLYVADGFVALQPFRGVELRGGEANRLRTGDAYLWRAERPCFPRGMARTLRFTLSLNPARAPHVARYLAPAWWYGLCEEYQPKAILPVVNDYDETVRTAREWCRTHMIQAGFTEGFLPFKKTATPDDRSHVSSEGDVPGGLFLAAYRAGDAEAYGCALRAAYAFTDVLVDHAVKRVRLIAYPPGSVSLCLNRMHGAVMGWLETGDAYLLNTAQAVTENAYWWHKNSWPRRAVGRDARFVHTQMVLYRYLGEPLYLERTRTLIADLATAQWPDGSFGDQGGGCGIHGYAAYISKPWMGCLATFGVMDYLEHVPDDPVALGVVKKFVDYLMRERAPRAITPGSPEKGTAMGWTYQHWFKGKPLPGYEVPEGATPGYHLFHLDYLARLLTWYSFRTGDPRYFAAFVDTYRGAGLARDAGYHHGTSAFLCIPWLEDRLWNATVTTGGVAVEATYLGSQTPKTGRILTPIGELVCTWTAPGRIQAPKDVRCVVVDLTKDRGTKSWRKGVKL